MSRGWGRAAWGSQGAPPRPAGAPACASREARLARPPPCPPHSPVRPPPLPWPRRRCRRKKGLACSVTQSALASSTSSGASHMARVSSRRRRPRHQLGRLPQLRAAPTVTGGSRGCVRRGRGRAASATPACLPRPLAARLPHSHSGTGVFRLQPESLSSQPETPLEGPTGLNPVFQGRPQCGSTPAREESGGGTCSGGKRRSAGWTAGPQFCGDGLCGGAFHQLRRKVLGSSSPSTLGSSVRTDGWMDVLTLSPG